MLRPATSTLNCGVTDVTARPIPKQFLHELDDLGVLLEEDFAEELDFAELLVMADDEPPFPLLLLDFGVTLELDFTLLLDFGVTLEEDPPSPLLLLDFALLEDFALELDCGVTLELELTGMASK